MTSRTLIGTLNIVRMAINHKLREKRMLAIIEDARQIQTRSCRVTCPTRGFRNRRPQRRRGDRRRRLLRRDHRSRRSCSSSSLPMPPATGCRPRFQVRDVFTGLRMGLSREFKLTRTLESLNRIIHRSRLATKFVSLFLAEVQPHRDGSLLQRRPSAGDV